MNNIYIYVNNPIVDLPDCKNVSVQELSAIETESVDNLYIMNLLDVLNITDQQGILESCISKLKPNIGQLHIQSTDLKLFCNAVTFDKISLEASQQILYRNRIYMHTMNDIVKLMEASNLKCIIKKYINVFEYYISCVKINDQ